MKRYIKNLNKWLLLILLFSIVVIVLIEFWLINVPEKVSWGYEFGKILYPLCMAYISSFIFYFVTVHMKNVRDKTNIKPYIYKNVTSVIGFHTGIHNSFQNSAQPSTFQGKILFNESEYLDLLTRILNNGDRISPLQAITFSQLKEPTLIFLLTQIQVIKKLLEDSVIVSQNHYSEFIKIATSILDSELFRVLVLNEYLIINRIMILNSSNINQIAKWLAEYDEKTNMLYEYLMKMNS
jgi:hypothetical protein